MLKRILIWVCAMVLGVVIGVGLAQAQTWYPANQATVAWDAVTKLSDGTNIPTGDTVKYIVYTQLPAPALPVQVTPTAITATQLLLTFEAEGRYFVGIKAQRISGGAVVGESSIAWSNTAVATNNAPWGIQSFLTPASPVNLRKP